jgi:hypothetical protein
MEHRIREEEEAPVSRLQLAGSGLFSVTGSVLSLPPWEVHVR